MGRLTFVCALCLFLPSFRLMADSWPVQIEFANGSKSEGWLTDLNTCEGEFHWSDGIDRPYWSGAGSSAKAIWPIEKLGQVQKLDLAPFTPAERQKIIERKLRQELVKATVTFVDGEIKGHVPRAEDPMADS